MSVLYPKSLDASKQQIRLLELLSLDTSIKWKLHTVTLDNDLHFAALSYVWGDKSVTTDIEINGTVVPITTNLAAALKHVRSYWQYEFPSKDQSSFRIWVDALCIDQSNTQERSEQVLLMPKIYTSASLVLGWLGDQGNIELMQAAIAVRVLHNAFRSGGWDPVRLSSDLSWLTECPALIQAPTCDKLWNSLSYLGSLQYWKRIWILQENVLASTVLYISPNAMIEKSSLMHVCFMLSQILRRELEIRNAQKPESVPDHIWFKFRPPESTEFSGVREITRFWTASAMYIRQSEATTAKDRLTSSLQISEIGGTLLATDPRDHIFGLLGLCSLPVKVNYNEENKAKHVYSEYCKVVLDILRKLDDRTYFFLRDAGIGAFNNNDDLPSWAPNYPERAAGEPTLVFDAKLKLVDIEPEILFASLSGPVLSLAVVRIQSLDTIGGSPILKNLTEGEVRTWCHDFVLRHPSYPNQRIPALWVLFLVTMRMQSLILDTSTMLLLQHFIISLQYTIPPSPHKTQRTQIPHHIKTPEVKGLSVGVNLDGSQNPEMMVYVSPDVGSDVGYRNPSQSLEKRMFEIRARLVFLLERNVNSKLFDTDEGFLGMGPKYCEPGDIVCLVDGYDDLVLIRKCSDRYQFVGPCMVLGVSRTYIKNQLAEGKLKVEIVELV
ncbi:heterokaryon incompatibility protein-domain-containing protein [Cadophora sp. MPI-SDFR-AT-0126]|nr:heterokaryon incompatibility protein-domain-containing protein [Leotiomycetes sp. MPI-SDFR-AT-0126]